jgi:hypothetical protein
MMAEITVHESSVDKVKPGQKASVVMDAFPDQTFHGEVIKIAPLPDQQRGWLSPDIKVYTTQVSIEGTHDFLKPGMSARVTIFVDEVPDALIVPVQVVANRSGKKICFVVHNGRSEEREVKTGLFNDTHVQITDGLQAGEDVLLNPPRITETKVEPERQLAAADRPKKTGQSQNGTRDSGLVARSASDERRATSDDSIMRDPNRAGRRPQNMAFDPNQMDEQTRERFRQSRNRMRQQNDGANPGQ